ncbi:hypothetical protein Glove_230g78 [Diversispora epigaea]|uniref:DNA2/NAM7 helicase helicase domain-containing protein n=1 Tax=Diversispora epigaea TaxID=1348612 RepID=A0A397IH74_9GLOM|nr:hypothetical protein Glove_230g78 [Diversispora epigaea]
MFEICEKLENLKNEWKNSFDKPIAAAFSSDPLATDKEQRKYFFIVLDREIDRTNGMLRKPKHKLHDIKNASPMEDYKQVARNADLKRSYDPPDMIYIPKGELSANGSRHNNDFAEISRISIIPTTDEILCKRDPYLPVVSGNDDLHHLPKGAARLLDRQFRLLREDMLNAFRTSINSFLTLIGKPNGNRVWGSGGRYRCEKSDGGDLNVYPNIRFTEVVADSRNGFFFRVAFTPPSTKMSNRTFQDRRNYWQNAKKLGNGNLVCLLWPNEDINNYVENSNSAIASKYSIYFGTIAHRNEDILAENREFAEIGINFIDTSLHPIAIKDISFRHKNKSQIEYRFLVESTDLLFESFKNILKTLQETDPSDIPFKDYFAPQFEYISNEPASVNPPIYTIAPNFRFNLATLLDPKSRDQNVYLNVSDSQSHNDVIKTLINGSTLDESQAKALVSSLCREVALIEGPPGTGKSYVGVGIMRALLAPENREATKIGPILTICYTNHALDNFLEDLLKNGIDNIVRIGSRSKSEIISEFSLEEKCRNRKGQNKWLVRQTHQDLEEIIKEASTINNQLTSRTLTLHQMRVIEENYQIHYLHLKNPDIPSFLLDNNESGWQKANGKRKQKKRSIIKQWVNGDDLTAAQKYKESFMNPRKKLEEKGKRDENTYTLLKNYGDYMKDSDGSDDNDDNSDNGDGDGDNDTEKDIIDEGNDYGDNDIEKDIIVNNDTSKDIIDDSVDNGDDYTAKDIIDDSDDGDDNGDNDTVKDIIDVSDDNGDNDTAKDIIDDSNDNNDRIIVKRAFDVSGYNGDDYNGDDYNSDEEAANWIQTWQMPTTKRSLELLKRDWNVWGMSKEERVRLYDFWREEINSETNEELSDIQRRYVKKKKELEDIYDEGRRQVLLNSDVIGMTTSGAAKHHELIK